ncbi:hypothetical protein ACP70R_025690 [Stipagrostis hirtigluma subsp. patula]
MDPGSEATPTSPPEGTTRPLDRPRHPSFRRQEGEHTMDVDETPCPGQSTEDTQREAKKARWQKLMTAKRRPPRIDWSPPRCMKPGYSFQTGEDSELKQRARIVGQAVREELKRLNQLDETIYPEKPVEGLRPCSSKPQVEYCMSDEFIEQLDRQAKLYFSRMKQTSRKQVLDNGLKNMTREAFMAFQSYLEENDLLEGFHYKFGEVSHYCFSVENYSKVYTHYNFTTESKKRDEDRWTSNRYFAEAKLMDGEKYYFCSPLGPTDDGECYACKNKGVELKHPPGGGYQKGHEGSGFGYMDSSSGEELVLTSDSFGWLPPPARRS